MFWKPSCFCWMSLAYWATLILNLVEAAWSSGQSVGFEIRRSRVQIPFWPLADVVLGNFEFNFTLVNSQLVCLPPVEILNLVMFIWILIYIVCFHWSWKAPMGSGQIRIHFYTHTISDFTWSSASRAYFCTVRWAAKLGFIQLYLSNSITLYCGGNR